jgi:methylmalonyl-CoA mutase N-terminal domain/subunit
VEEVAFTLADGIAYVDAAVRRGLAVDEFAPRIAFFFNAHNNFLEEVAKFRAARRLWATVMRDRFGAKDERSMMLRFHTQTAGSSLTAQQPQNNVVRTTLQALAAVFGGTQSLHTNGFDEALGLPTEPSAQLALRTQQIIAEESGVIAAADPLGGSYLIESLTDAIEAEAMKRIEKIDSMGGMLEAIERRYPQGEIESSAYEAQRAMESGASVVVGVNKFRESSEEPPAVLRIDPTIEEGQVSRLKAFKGTRDVARVQSTLSALQKGAQGEENLMPLIIECARASCTLGEISDALRFVFGEHHEI